ncbi:MAG: lysophospholipid acyltransferase family protein [Candidatus Binatia bacterium]
MRRKGSLIEKFLYSLRYRLAEFALRAFVAILPWVPYSLLVLYTRFSAWVTFGCLWKYRTRMENNVAMAMGEELTTPVERTALVWRAWNNFALGILETSAVMHFPREQIIHFVTIEGEDHLKRAIAKGKGVIALSAHLGAFTLIGARLAAAGYPFSVVVKHPGDERFARLIDRYRAQIGIGTISAKPRREAARGILKALRENRIVLVIADEFKSGGLMVNFLGQISPAPRGPATLALRTGAPTLPMFATRRPDGAPILRIGAEVELIRSEDVEQSVAETTRLFTRYLEEAIRRYPDQWNWLGFRRNGIAGHGIRRRRRKRRGDSQPQP